MSQIIIADNKPFCSKKVSQINKKIRKIKNDCHILADNKIPNHHSTRLVLRRPFTG